MAQGMEVEEGEEEEEREEIEEPDFSPPPSPEPGSGVSADAPTPPELTRNSMGPGGDQRLCAPARLDAETMTPEDIGWTKKLSDFTHIDYDGWRQLIPALADKNESDFNSITEDTGATGGQRLARLSVGRAEPPPPAHPTAGHA
jgi:hypothetical protein